MRIRTRITAALLSLIASHAYATVPVVGNAEIYLDTLVISQMPEMGPMPEDPPPPATLFGISLYNEYFNTSAFAQDIGGVENSDTSLNSAANALTPGFDTTANADLVGSTLTTTSDATRGTAFAGATDYRLYAVEYLTDWDFGGYINVSVDYAMGAQDFDPNNPNFPATDVSAEVGLEIFAFLGLQSDPTDADSSLVTALFGFPQQGPSGTLTTSILLPSLPAGNIVTLLVESTVQSFATSAVPVPPAVWLFASAVGALVVTRSRKVA